MALYPGGPLLDSMYWLVLDRDAGGVQGRSIHQIIRATGVAAPADNSCSELPAKASPAVIDGRTDKQPNSRSRVCAITYLRAVHMYLTYLGRYKQRFCLSLNHPSSCLTARPSLSRSSSHHGRSQSLATALLLVAAQPRSSSPRPPLPLAAPDTLPPSHADNFFLAATHLSFGYISPPRSGLILLLQTGTCRPSFESCRRFRRRYPHRGNSVPIY